jgi:hypothetical protein
VAEAEQRSGGRLRARLRALLGLPFVGLAAVGLAAGAGVFPARLRMLALHLVVACLGVGCTVVVSRLLARRRQRQRRRQNVRWGVRLRPPLWIKLEMLGLVLAFAGLLAALPAAVGLSSVSVGVLLAMAAVGGTGLFGGKLLAPDLTLEDDGLRIHVGAVSCQVGWDLITRVEAIGPDHFTGLQLFLSDRAAVVASTAPATPAARAEIEGLLSTRRGDGASLYMFPWTAGLDGVVLERAIQSGRRREPQRGTGLN